MLGPIFIRENLIEETPRLILTAHILTTQAVDGKQ